MTSKQAIDKIMNVLGLTNRKFYEAKTEQGIVVKTEGDLELGAMIYVATEEGMIPAPDGSYKMEDGSEVEVTEGKITKIKMGDVETEVETEDEKIEDAKEEESQEFKVQLEFGDIKLKDGNVIRVGYDEAMVGVRVLKVGYDNTLSAIHDGDYETTEGKIISIAGGSIIGIKDKFSFTIAESAQGAKLESPTFDVGEEVYVLDGDSKTPAPDGEHQVILKDESGNENKIRIITKDGKITQRENVEDMKETMSADEVVEIFASALKKIEEKIDSISQKQTQLETNFKKFSAEPAGERIYTQKTINETSSLTNNKFEAFKQMMSKMS